MRAGGCREGAARASFHIQQKPRFRSEKSAADTKLEKTSLSAGGFLRVSYGYGSWLWLHDRQAIDKQIKLFVRGILKE
jgi:hypothetical protein